MFSFIAATITLFLAMLYLRFTLESFFSGMGHVFPGGMSITERKLTLLFIVQFVANVSMFIYITNE